MTSEKIRALIVDDEPLAREGIRLMLQRDADVEIVGEAADGGTALKAIRALKPQLLFLDVQMPVKNGIQVLDELDEEVPPVVIFVTAYDQYAIQAFERSALDYLLKPFDDDRFEKTVQRAKGQLRRVKAGELNRKLLALLDNFREGGAAAVADAAAAMAAPGTGDGRWLTRLAIKSSGRITFLRTDEIDWIGAADYYVELHVAGKAHLLREAMAKLETRLDPKRFLRIHRSTVVHIDRIKELHPMFSGDYAVILRDNTELALSRNYRERFLELFENQA